MIKKVSKTTVYTLETEEDGDYTEYLRFGPNCWYFAIGESLEACYDCERLEKLFTEHQEQKQINILNNLQSIEVNSQG